MKVLKKIFCMTLSVTLIVAICSCEQKKNYDSDIPTLEWYVPGDKQPDISMINEAISKITEEKIGIKVQINFIDQAAYDEKMSMIDASGEKYDLCFAGYLNKYWDAATKGALYDITDMIDSHVDLKNSFPQYIWDAAEIDGRIYAVPNYQIEATTTGFSVNKELADKYNLDINSINKTEDLEPFLKKIKENEPGIYPFRTNWGVASFVSKGEQHEHKGQDIIGYVKKDGKIMVVPEFEVGRTYEKAKILYDWFKKGYIRKDVASIMDDSQDARMGKYAVQTTAYKPGVEAEDKIYMGADVYSFTLSTPVLNHISIRNAMIAVGVNSKYPEKALDFIELINTDKELYNIVCFGIEGTHYTKIGENRIRLTEKSGYNPNASWKFGNQFNAYLIDGQDDDVWEQSEKINKEAAKSTSFGFDPNYSNVKTQYLQCVSVKSEYDLMNRGAIDPDTYFDELKKKMWDAGLQEIIDEIQRQLDEFYMQ